MGLFRRIGKAVSGRPTDIKDMTVSEVIDYKSTTADKLAKKAKVSPNTIKKYSDTLLVEVPTGTQNKIKKVLGIVG